MTLADVTQMAPVFVISKTTRAYEERDLVSIQKIFLTYIKRNHRFNIYMLTRFIPFHFPYINKCLTWVIFQCRDHLSNFRSFDLNVQFGNFPTIHTFTLLKTDKK